jgi:hypothetical protein
VPVLRQKLKGEMIMKMTNVKKFLSFPIILALVAAMALCVVGCKGSSVETPATSSTGSSGLNDVSSSQNASADEVTKLGEGETQFNFTVVDVSGKETAFLISTNKKTVGDALTELELIVGEQGAYGLYVKTVNGITLDYDKDGKYWAFYEDGAYAAKGVDSTEIVDGKTYSFKAE